MAGVVGLLSFVLSIVICCILIVSSSKTATTHSGNVMYRYFDFSVNYPQTKDLWALDVE